MSCHFDDCDIVFLFVSAAVELATATVGELASRLNLDLSDSTYTITSDSLSEILTSYLYDVISTKTTVSVYSLRGRRF